MNRYTWFDLAAEIRRSGTAERERLEDRIVDLEFQRDDALARVAELEAQVDRLAESLADLTASCPRTFAHCPFSPEAS